MQHQHQLIQRPHSTTPTPSRKLHLHLHHHHHHHHHHRYQQQTNHHHHQHSWSSDPSTNPLLPPVTPKSTSSTRSSPLQQPRHRTPPSPLLSPIPYPSSRLAPNNGLTLTRANSLPGQTPPRSSRPSPRSRFHKPPFLHGSSPPALTRLPTSPTPASAVTGQSGLTVSGRMVEYESDHSRSEALSRALRAVSQSGMGRSRNRSRQGSPAIKHRSLSYTAVSSSSGNEERCSEFNDNMTPMNREEGYEREIIRPRAIGRRTTLTPPTPTGDQELEVIKKEEREFPSRYEEGWAQQEVPNSQASGYISFSSLNLFAPPSPPHSLNNNNTFCHLDSHNFPSSPPPTNTLLETPIPRPFTP